eukprot:30735-Pelagococcus_subviridis.AAC.8
MIFFGSLPVSLSVPPTARSPRPRFHPIRAPRRAAPRPSSHAPYVPFNATTHPPQVTETAEAAATRELYEEIGVRVGDAATGLRFVASIPPSDEYCYLAGGWLAKKGLAGQRLEFSLFHLPTTEDPAAFCDLRGLDGEPAEFSRVKWARFAEVIDSVWESKRGPYLAASEAAAPIIAACLSGE